MSQNSSHCVACVSRRAVLAAAVGGVGAVLAGCTSYGDTPAAPAPVGSPPAGSSAAGSPAGSPAASPGVTPSAPAAVPSAPSAPVPSSTAAVTRVAALVDIPIGGGVIVAGQNIVVTQPTEGDIVAFSATCTHAGCAVTEVRDGLIRCPCHGSTFDITTGQPTGGPANGPLPGIAVTVSGTDVVLA